MKENPKAVDGAVDVTYWWIKSVIFSCMRNMGNGVPVQSCVQSIHTTSLNGVRQHF